MKLNKHQCFSPAGISFHSIVSVQLIPTVLLLLFTKTSITITIVHTFVIDCSRATVTNDEPVRICIAALQHHGRFCSGKMPLKFSEENVKNKFLFPSFFPLCSLCNLQIQVVLEASVSSAGTEIIWTKHSVQVIMRFKAEKGKMMRYCKKKKKNLSCNFFDLYDFRVSRFLQI